MALSKKLLVSSGKDCLHTQREREKDTQNMIKKKGVKASDNDFTLCQPSKVVKAKACYKLTLK